MGTWAASVSWLLELSHNEHECVSGTVHTQSEEEAMPLTETQNQLKLITDLDISAKPIKL